MAGNCSKANCYPEETGCNYEGCEVLTECPNYRGGDKDTGTDMAASAAVNTDDDYFVRMPWTGSSMGLQDLEYLCTSKQANVIGVTGVASAGKTTFLATLYCLLRNGHTVGDYQFAGSLTLNGWESIAWYLSWKQNNAIHFPPHTTSNAGRVPGLLHLTLATPSGDKKDLIFTDAPGEWFDNWAFNENDPNAQGALWIHRNADAFLLFADCETLSGPQLGQARKQIRLVADRIKQNLGKRPFGLIWSKSDIPVEKNIKAQIGEYINNTKIKHYQEFETSVREGEGINLHSNICDSIAWLLASIRREENSRVTISVTRPGDLFLSKR